MATKRGGGRRAEAGTQRNWLQLWGSSTGREAAAAGQQACGGAGGNVRRVYQDGERNRWGGSSVDHHPTPPPGRRPAPPPGRRPAAPVVAPSSAHSPAPRPSASTALVYGRRPNATRRSTSGDPRDTNLGGAHTLLYVRCCSDDPPDGLTCCGLRFARPGWNVSLDIGFCAYQAPWSSYFPGCRRMPIGWPVRLCLLQRRLRPTPLQHNRLRRRSPVSARWSR